MQVELMFQSLGRVLRAPMRRPPGLEISACVGPDLRRSRACLGPRAPCARRVTGGPLWPGGCGSIAGAGACGCSIGDAGDLPSLKRERGDLDRVGRLHGRVRNGRRRTRLHPDDERDQPLCRSPAEALRARGEGRHARTAIGMAQLPLDLPVVVAAEVGHPLTNRWIAEQRSGAGRLARAPHRSSSPLWQTETVTIDLGRRARPCISGVSA
jgi:hypothetical protein